MNILLLIIFFEIILMKKNNGETKPQSDWIKSEKRKIAFQFLTPTGILLQTQPGLKRCTQLPSNENDFFSILWESTTLRPDTCFTHPIDRYFCAVEKYAQRYYNLLLFYEAYDLCCLEEKWIKD